MTEANVSQETGPNPENTQHMPIDAWKRAE